MPGINSKNYRYVVTHQHYCYMYTECMYMYTHVPIALQTPAIPLMRCTCTMYMYVARNTDTGNLVVRSRNGFKFGAGLPYTTVEPHLADTCDITDNSECPDRISIDFNIFKPPQQQIPRYSVQRTLILVPFEPAH